MVMLWCSLFVLVMNLIAIHQLFNGIFLTNRIAYGCMLPFENCFNDTYVLTTVNDSSFCFRCNQAFSF
jgi:hypothetical protein